MARQATQEEIVSDVVRNLLSPPLPTLTLGRPSVPLPRPRAAVSHADWHQGPQGLPWLAVIELFRHLPVLDLFRLGHLFTPRWREVWRNDRLVLHDRQLTDAIPRSEVADAITYLLEEYVDGDGDGDGAEGRGRLASFRVESTEWGPAHAARWCALLRRGEASEVVLFNRCHPPMLIRVPRALLGCTTVRILHLGFFTVEAGELDALAATTDLGLHGCACRAGVVEGVVAACGDLQKLSVQDGAMQDVSVVVRSARRLRSLSMLHTVSSSLTVDDAPDLLQLVPGSPRALSISRAPALRHLLRLNLPDTSLKIDGAEIAVGVQATEPQMQSVDALWLALDYTVLRGMEEHMVPRVVAQMLRRFTFVTHLTIERKDAVPQEEGVVSMDDPHTHTHGHLNLFDGLEGVAQRLRTLTLLEYRGGKAELALARAITDSAQALERLDLS